MTTLYLDLETFGDVDLKKVGAYRYAETAEVLLVAFAWGEHAPVDVVAFDPAYLQALILSADKIVVHNSNFDRVVLARHRVLLPTRKIHDTMALALLHGLPGSLDKLCTALNLPVDKAKDKEGKKLINLFCKPRPKAQRIRRATQETHPEKWAQFVEYARRDVEAMREVYARLPTFNNDVLYERELWLADQAINDRGVAIDLDLARCALRAFDRVKAGLTDKVSVLTGGEVTSFTQGAKLREHINAGDYGVYLPNLLKGTLRDAISERDTEGVDVVREIMEGRLEAASTSPTKYATLLAATCSDGRLRGTLQYCGASRTGRWAGRVFQPQNLPRATLKAHVVDVAIEAMKTDCEDLIFDHPIQACVSAVRGVIVAPQGKKLVVADLSNIEGRVLAWLAGEEWKTKAFSEYDAGRGHDLYVLAYARSFNLSPEEVLADYKAGGLMRQIGKVQELALGYQGGEGAFNQMAKVYGVNLPSPRVVEIVRAWRGAHRNTVSLWYDTEAAVRRAMHCPDAFTVARGLIRITKEGKWLLVRLPSGRDLCYLNMRFGEEGALTYDGVDQFTRRWGSIETYGGKLVENIVQSVARDVMARGILAAEKAGYSVVIHVHDEIVTEVDDDARFSPEGLAECMSSGISWSLGLPLAAKGFEALRYRKD